MCASSGKGRTRRVMGPNDRFGIPRGYCRDVTFFRGGRIYRGGLRKVSHGQQD